MRISKVIDLEYYRDQLEDVIVSDDGLTEFRFTSRVQANPDMDFPEEYANIGSVIIKDVTKGDIYHANYILVDFGMRIDLDITFKDFRIILSSFPLWEIVSGNQGQLLGRFDHVMELLHSFPIDSVRINSVA
ncbi:hypothetical protein [Pedobacter jeongneungensis]|uniref:hypothetical protein n=1 Tax=Pedobacter jeongneungensis TaxID=947309 RepID=UPI000469A0BF|nr:hypothetical protein [Pedobacter jeongneungensis]